MAVWAEVKLSLTEKENRWGAEFYHPRYLAPLPKQFTWKPIGRVLTFCQYGLSRAMNDDGIGHPMYRMNEMDDIFLATPQRFAETTVEEYEDFRLSRNDVLFNRTNSFDFVGRTGILKHEVNAVFASYLVRVRPNPKDILPEFLALYLSASFGVTQVKRRAMRSINQANVSASELKRVPIPLVPLKIQQTLAQWVDDAAIRRQSAARLYCEAEALLVDALRLDEIDLSHKLGYETSLSEVGATHRWDAQCYHPRLVNHQTAVAEFGAEPLGHLCYSSLKGQQQDEQASGSIPYASIKHIADFEVVTDKFCSLDAASAKVAREDDLLLAITGATIGKIGLVARYQALAFSGDLLRLRPRAGLDPLYLLVFLRSPAGQAQLLRWVTGSTNGHLAPHDVMRALVPRLGKTEASIAAKVREAVNARTESEQLLDKAKLRVEELIEKGVAA